jgi:hypothetical protein
VLEALAIVVGLALVITALADMLNTLVTTQTSQARWWLTGQLYRRSWTAMRWIASHLRDERIADRLLGTFAPLSVLLLLTAWVVQQIVGFGLIWWGLGGIAGADSLGDALYYSGVVYFTLGFGEVVPAQGDGARSARRCGTPVPDDPGGREPSALLDVPSLGAAVPDAHRGSRPDRVPEAVR